MAAWSRKSRVLRSYVLVGTEGHTVWDIRAGGGVDWRLLGASLPPKRGGGSACPPTILEPRQDPRRVEALLLADVAEIVARAPRSALGPDGVPHACCALEGEGRRHPCHPCLSSCVAFARGHPLPALFNQSWLVLIPKAPLALDTANAARPASSRPLSKEQLPEDRGQGAACTAGNDCADGGAQCWCTVCKGYLWEGTRRHPPSSASMLRQRISYTTRAPIPASCSWTFRRRSQASIGDGCSGCCMRSGCRTGCLVHCLPSTTARTSK